MFKKNKKLFGVLMLIVSLIIMTGCDNISIEEDVGSGPKEITHINGNVSVLNEDGKKEPIQGASVMVNDNMAETNDKGNYSIAVPPGKYEVVATFKYEGEQITQKDNLEIPKGNNNFKKDFQYQSFGELNLKTYAWINGGKVLLEHPSLTTIISNHKYVVEDPYQKEIAEDNEINLKLENGKYDLHVEVKVGGETHTIDDNFEIKSGEKLNYTAEFNKPDESNDNTGDSGSGDNTNNDNTETFQITGNINTVNNRNSDPIENIEVEIYNYSGFYETATTNDSYNFDLAAGNYTVIATYFYDDTGEIFTDNADFSVTDETSTIPELEIVIPDNSVPDGGSGNTDNTNTEYPVSGYVSVDNQRNFDIIENVNVELYQNSELLETTTTEYGSYDFQLTPGDYTLKASYEWTDTGEIYKDEVSFTLPDDGFVSVPEMEIVIPDNTMELTGTVNLNNERPDLYSGSYVIVEILDDQNQSIETEYVDTNSTNQYTAELEPGDYTLKANYDGYSIDDINFSIQKGDTTFPEVNIDIIDERIELTGQVVFNNERPDLYSSSYINASIINQSTMETEQTLSLNTSDTEYNVNLEPGNYTLEIDYDSYSVNDINFSVQEGDTTAPNIEIDIIDERVELTGRLMVMNPYLPESVDNVQPESNYNIEVYQNSSKITETTTDSDGYYSLTLDPGNYDVPNPHKPMEMIELTVQEGVNTIPDIEYELVLTDLSNYFDFGERDEEVSGGWVEYQVGDYDLSDWDTSNVSNMDEMFFEADSFNQNINNWDVSKVESMVGMFEGDIIPITTFNQPLDSWNVGNVRNMERMFDHNNSFNQNINNWDVSRVENMTAMFNNATSFNQPLNGWDVGNVENISQMFYYAENFNQDLSTWDFSSITSLSNIDSMVSNSGLNQTNYNNLVDAIYNTNSHGWTTTEIESTIGTPNTGVSYTGSN